MKKEKNLKLTKNICNFLVLIAPAIISKPYSLFFWGEVTVPEILKNDLSREK